MEDIWIEDRLYPTDNQIDENIRGNNSKNSDDVDVNAIVRTGIPKWKKIVDEPNDINTYWLIHIRFEFETLRPVTKFQYANCQAYVQNEFPDEPLSTVIQIFPRNITEDGPKDVNIKIEPSFKLSFANLSAEVGLGEISKQFVGRISSETVGFFGDNDCKPHWKLNPGRYQIDGIRDFFFVVRQPFGCRKISVRTLVEARIETHKGLFHVRPKGEKNIWEYRRKIVIS